MIKQNFAAKMWKRMLSTGLSLAMAVTMIPSVGIQAGEEDAQTESLVKAGSVAATDDTRTRDQPFASFTGGSANFSSPAFVVRQVVEALQVGGDTMVKPTTGMTTDLMVAAAEAKYGVTRDGGGQDIIASVSKDGGNIWKYSFPFYFPDSVGSGHTDATTISSPVLVDDEKLNENTDQPGWVVGGTTYCLANVYPGGVAVTSASGFTYPGAGSGYVEVEGIKRLALTDTYAKAAVNPTSSDADYAYYVGDFDAQTGRAPVMTIVADGADTASDYQVDQWYNLYKKTAGGNTYEAIDQDQIGSGEKVQQNVFYKGSELHVYNTGYIMCVTSEDGENWSSPEILNPFVYHSEDENIFLSSGKGLKTTGNRLLIQAYSKTSANAGSNASMIWHCPAEGHTWHRSGNVPAFKDAEEENAGPAWMEGSGMVELSTGKIRMFLRNGRNILYYADADRVNPDDSELTDVFEFSAPVATGTSITADSRMSAIEYSKPVNAERVIMVTAPTGASHTDGHLMTFGKRAATEGAEETITRIIDYPLQSGNFASASMDEMNYGSKIGVLWETGLGRVRFEDYYTLDVLGNDHYASGLEYDLELRPGGDAYTRSYHVEGVDNMVPEGETPSADDSSIATVGFERGTPTEKEVVTLYSHTDNPRATNLKDTYNATIDNTVNIENAEFTITKIRNDVDNVYSVYSEGMQRYLTNADRVENLFTTTLRNYMEVKPTENGGKFTIRVANIDDITGTANLGSYILFNKLGMTIDRHNGTTGENWDYDFLLLEKMNEGETAGEGEELVSGYRKVSEVTSGRKYLIAHVVEAVDGAEGHTGTGGVVILYPRNTKTRHAKLVGPKQTMQVAATKTLTITPANKTGKTTLTVNKTTYNINVKHETIRVAKGGNYFIEGATESRVTLGDASSYVTAEEAQEERKAFFKRTNSYYGDNGSNPPHPNSLAGYNVLDAGVDVETAEFTVTETGETKTFDDDQSGSYKLYTIYNENENLYLVNNNAKVGFYLGTARSQTLKKIVNGDETVSFEIRRDDKRYVYYWHKLMRFDGVNQKVNGSQIFADEGDFGFEFLKKKTDGSVADTDPIPGYERVDEIESGASYLITEYYTEPGEDGKSGILILYPQDGIDNMSRMYTTTLVDGVKLTVNKDAQQENPVEITVGDKKYELEVETCDHIYPTRTVGDREPSCGVAGATGDVFCSHCNEQLESSKEIPALAHRYGEYQPDPEHMPSYEGTGTDGEKVAVCSRCGNKDRQTYPALEYANDVLDQMVADAEQNIVPNESSYTETTYGVFSTALTAAKDVAENAVLATVAGLIGNLEKAQGGLVTKALQTKRDNLKAQIVQALLDAENEDYTEATKTALLEAVGEYKDLTEEELIAAIEEIDENQLEEKTNAIKNIPRLTVADEKLQVAREELEGLIQKEEFKNLYEGGNADKKYTDETWNVFAKAYKDAMDELETADAERLKNLKTALENAKAALKEATKTQDKETGAVDGEIAELADGTYQVVSAKDKTVIITKGVDAKTIKVGPSVVIKNETYKVIGIGKGAFGGLKKATKVIINDNVTTIGEQAFAKSKKLKNVTIGKDVTSIGKKAFFNCPKLNKVILKGKVLTNKSFGKQAFKKTAKKATVKWPKGLKGKSKTQLKKAIKRAGLKVK